MSWGRALRSPFTLWGRCKTCPYTGPMPRRGASLALALHAVGQVQDLPLHRSYFVGASLALTLYAVGQVQDLPQQAFNSAECDYLTSHLVKFSWPPAPKVRSMFGLVTVTRVYQ